MWNSRNFPNNFFKSLAKRCGIDFVELSVKNDNVDDIFIQAVKNVINNFEKNSQRESNDNLLNYNEF